MPPSGNGKKRILLCGEAPGHNEDDKGIQFVGQSGKLLESILEDIGIDMRRDCWITNSLLCHPEGNIIKNNRSIEYCRPNLVRAIKELQPEVIIPLGARAVQSLIGWLWKEDIGSFNRWIGWQIPSQQINAWICSTWHPAYLLRGVEENSELLEREFTKHLKAATSLVGRPWDKVPDWTTKIQRILDEDKAAEAITKLLHEKPEMLAFDYETNMLKPDSADAKIISCAISDGKTTIAYPWYGESINQTKVMIQSKIPKIASNLKFEERWTIKAFGIPVTNWKLDTMIASHVLDNRVGINSVKFQAFVLLGIGSYDKQIKEYFQAKAANEVNRIKEIPIDSLLLYNGLDALLEYKVAKIQMKLLL